MNNKKEEGYHLLFKKSDENTAKELLTILYKAPFSIINDKNILTLTCEKYSEKGDEFNNFLYYFKNQWMIYFNNGMLNNSCLKHIDLIVILKTKTR